MTSRATWRVGERCGAALARRYHSGEGANNTEHRETTTMPQFAGPGRTMRDTGGSREPALPTRILTLSIYRGFSKRRSASERSSSSKRSAHLISVISCSSVSSDRP